MGVYEYLGAGEFYPGIPARDIDDAEAAELGIEDALKASPHYKHHRSGKPSQIAEPTSETPAKKPVAPAADTSDQGKE